MTPYPFPKPCLDCGELSPERLCLPCQGRRAQTPAALERERKRRLHKRLLYGAGYRKRREIVLAAATHCAICGLPFVLGDLIEADHITPHPASELQAVHRRCNQAKSDKVLPE